MAIKLFGNEREFWIRVYASAVQGGAQALPSGVQMKQQLESAAVIADEAVIELRSRTGSELRRLDNNE